jgi:hypothetical protein
LLDETAGVDRRRLEVDVSPNERVIADLNAVKIVERDRIEPNAPANRRTPEPIEDIQNCRASQHPERSLERAKQLMDKKPAKVLRAPQLAFLGSPSSDRPHDQQCHRHRRKRHQCQPQWSRQEQLVRRQAIGAKVEEDEERDDAQCEDRRPGAEDQHL